MSPTDDPTPVQLRAEQSARERDEHDREQHATTVAGARAAGRRADKAAYLKDKLDEQVASDEPG